MKEKYVSNQKITSVLFSMVTVLAVTLFAYPHMVMGEDLIINGTTASVSGGSFDTVYVANDGNLTVNGTLGARTVEVAQGTMIIRGNMAVKESVIVHHGGNLHATGINNTVGIGIDIKESGTASLSGVWSTDWLTVQKGGVLSVFAHSSAIPQSGKMTVHAHSIYVEQGGLVSGNYAGNDPRGRASSFANAGGGGHGGNGAPGWWSASARGYAFGDSYTFVSDMGSAGGRMGGGGIALIGEDVVIDGDIQANGQNGSYAGFHNAPGGGSGGTILIKAKTLSLTGTLSSKGGNGDSHAGPGGGGRIKVFYENGGGTNLLPLCSVTPGPTYTDKGPAQAGTVWIDAIPSITELLAPARDAIVPANTIFHFIVQDNSVELDGRDDALFCAIEFSTDGFETITYRSNQSVSPSGWSELSYKNGSEVIFSLPLTIPEGSYTWRAFVRDRSLGSEPSEERIVHIGKKTYVPHTALQIDRAVRLRFKSEKKNYLLQTSPNLELWNETDIVISGDGNLVEIYVPVETLDRYYRLLEL